MLWRLTRKEFEQQKEKANREAMKAIVESGKKQGGKLVDGYPNTKNAYAIRHT